VSDPARTAKLVAALTLVAAASGVGGPAPASTVSAHYRVSSSLQPSTVRFGHPVTVTGRVRPRAPGSVVKLQVSTEAGWRTVARSGLTRRSTFAATYSPPATGDYLLRVRKPAGGEHRRGTSRTMSLTVTPSLPPD
jgi:hypothetical protein